MERRVSVSVDTEVGSEGHMGVCGLASSGFLTTLMFPICTPRVHINMCFKEKMFSNEIIL